MSSDDHPEKTGDERLDQRLDELAEKLREPHDDEEERRRRRDAAREAGENPRREGEGIHPGTH